MQTEHACPHFFRVRQRFESQAIRDIAGAVQRLLAGAGLADLILPKQRVAIAVGSRGISNLSQIVAEIVGFVSSAGGQPIIVPAMGSHGGATSEGQQDVLAKYGVDSSMGCPIVSSMETVRVGTTSTGVEVYFDKVASESDHVIVVNRVKPHTRLVGQIESGLIKMLMIGLGKHRGATVYHHFFQTKEYCLDELAPEIVSMITERMPITLGLAIVEDALENTALLESVSPQSFLSAETRLLEIARSRMPRLPFEHAELLIVDQIGKEISGTGMDTNVVGRKANDRSAGPDEFPKIREIYVRSLSDKTAGNATGIGIAEYCHRRVVDAMDREVTKTNCITAAHASAGAIPLTFDCDWDAFKAVLSQSGKNHVAELKWMWISDTLRLEELACSSSYLSDARDRGDLTILSDAQPLDFDGNGDLVRLP